MEIGIRELKDRLSEILHRAHEGEKITITLHGRPLCEILPTGSTHIDRPAYLEKGIQEGWLTPSTTRLRQVVIPIKPKKAGKSTTELLRESRVERF